MMKKKPLQKPADVSVRADVDGFDSLARLALDMRWSWNHYTDEVWRTLDPVQWELTHNPWGLLQTVSKDRLQRAFADPEFSGMVDSLVQSRNRADETPAWFQLKHPKADLTSVAYFSMEFMVSESLPIYSGGLGNVAGDQLKAASDLGVPVVGVGLLYQQGYFRQAIDKNGAQQEFYPYNDPGQLPIAPVRLQNGEWLRLEIDLPGYSVWLRAWQAQVGRVKLYLLDSNDAANVPVHRGITSELYGGGLELRLKQEILLGIGGWRLLAALGIRPDVCQLNEGHAALAVLERALSFMTETGQAFEAALAVTRSGNLFTTHTAVPAGFDRFDPALIDQYLGGYAKKKLGLSLHDLLALGRVDPTDASESFTMAYLAIRGSGAVNGVSRLHGAVSRRLFAPLFPKWPEAEVPVGYVTNGVHMPSWDSAAADDLWTEACGKDRWLGETETLEQGIRRLSDARLWQFRSAASTSLVEYARTQLGRELAASGAPADAVEGAAHLFDPRALTLGFARRFASYKRPNLLLHDRDRLLRLLSDPERPVQLIMAGKAHPADQTGQALIREWVQFIRRPEVRAHAIFLGDYDMLLAERLVQGVDVWINTPRVGRRRGRRAVRRARARSDPGVLSRDASGIPTAWVRRMRESMARLTPRFSTNRTVREYTEQLYLPAAAAWRTRSANKGAVGTRIVEWQRGLENEWGKLRFGQGNVETTSGVHVFNVRLSFGGLNPDTVRVELYADRAAGSPPICTEMKHASPGAGTADAHLYVAQVPADRPAADFTARVVPHYDGVAVPLEAGRILWQR